MPNILGPGVHDKLTASVFFLVDGENNPIGTGFLVDSGLAVTVAHNFKDEKGRQFAQEGTEVDGHFGRPHLKQVVKLKVEFLDFVNDVCVLSGGPFVNFLSPVLETLKAGTKCILAAFQIGLHKDVAHLDTSLSLGVFKGAVSKAHARHFVYDCPSFSGDSGGALILSNGNVVGIHVETVNEARERLRLQDVDSDIESIKELNRRVQDVQARVEDVAKSVNSLTDSLSSGAIGISISSVLATYHSAEAKKSSGED